MAIANKINLRQAVIAGIVGTVVVDLLGLVLTQQFWDIPTLLGSKLGAGLAAGVVLHYGIGVVLAVIYAALAPSLPGGRYGRPMIYATVETVLGVYLFMFPLVGAGAFGLALGPMVPVISMLRHWGFAGVLGFFHPVDEAASTLTLSPEA